MAKYDPLSRYLKRKSPNELSLSFAEIERIIGALLPNAASRQEWWNDTDAAPSGVQHSAWKAAGYEASLHPGSETVRFSRPPRDE